MSLASGRGNYLERKQVEVYFAASEYQ